MREPEPRSARLHGRIVPSDFRPHPWFPNPHVQTLLPLLRPTPALTLDIERRELPDGDFVDLGWCGGSRAPLAGNRPLAILLHGMAGGFDSKYARGVARKLLKRGWRAVILQFRGAGPEPNRLPRCYHHGDTEDLRELVQLLRSREPRTPLYAVGWSLGGNVLLKYLGEEGAGTALSAAVAACAPFQIRPCAERLRSGFSRVYQFHLLSRLKRAVLRKHAHTPLQIDLEQLARARDFFEFDEAVTAPLNGFGSAEDYYARSACGQYLHGIARPTLIVHAQDDPFMVPDIIPDANHLPPCVTLELCEQGGHVGFVAADEKLLPHFWLDHRIAEHLHTLYRNSPETRSA